MITMRQNPIFLLSSDRPVCLGLCQNKRTREILPLFASYNNNTNKAYAFFYEALTSRKNRRQLIDILKKFEATVAYESIHGTGDRFKAYIDGVKLLLNYKKALTPDAFVSLEYLPKNNPQGLGTIRMRTMRKGNVLHFRSKQNCVALLQSETVDLKPIFTILPSCYTLTPAPKRNDCTVINLADYRKIPALEQAM